jgi:hypothetical protein
MEALELSIIGKNRTASARPARLTDFTFQPVQQVVIDALMNNPNISLYCLEHDEQKAVFVETVETADIYSQPFLYAAQYEHANKLYTLDLKTFKQIAETLPESKPILLYSLGRSGSTLLGNAFNKLDTVLSLSEPDVFGNLTGLRNAPLTEKEIVELSGACLKFLCKPSLNKIPTTWLVKFRGFGIEIADLIYQSSPKAINLFLYRDSEGWIRSMARLTKLLERNGLEPRPLFVYTFDYPAENHVSYLKYLNPKPQEMSTLEEFMLWWLSMMNRYLEHVAAGIPFIALRYQDLIRAPERMLEILFKQIGLESSDVAPALKAFGRDSQEGTRFSGKANRENPALELTDEHLKQVTKILQHHSQLSDADVILPNTIEVKQ